jgi:hypothetical protein
MGHRHFPPKAALQIVGKRDELFTVDSDVSNRRSDHRATTSCHHIDSSPSMVIVQ